VNKMSLDKILGFKPKKSTEVKKKTKPVHDDEDDEMEIDANSNHHFLKCTKKDCKFTRRLRKRTLDAKDLTCDKCMSAMKEVPFPKPKTKKEKTTEEQEDGE